MNQDQADCSETYWSASNYAAEGQLDASSEAGRAYRECDHQDRPMHEHPTASVHPRKCAYRRTVGRRSGKRHRIPVGDLDDSGRIIVVVEDGLSAHCIRNARANNNRLKVHFRGAWHEARLRMLDANPSSYSGFHRSMRCAPIYKRTA